VANAVQGPFSINSTLGPARSSHAFGIASPLGRQQLEHAVPGPYPRGIFPSLTAAVQLRPALETDRVSVPTRLRRPNRVQRPFWDYGPDTQRVAMRVEIDFGGGWEDVSTYVAGGTKASWGVHGAMPKDRCAEPGTLSFDLDNTDGAYSPDGSGVRAGFAMGAPARMVVTHPTYGDQVRWVGEISRITPRAGVHDPRTSVECVDWLEDAALSSLTGVAVQVDQQSDTIFRAIVAAMAAQPPGGVRVVTGSDIYPYALDTAQDESTRAISELQKLALSEYGFVYVDAGVAVFEGRRLRGLQTDPVFALDQNQQIIALALTAHDREQVLNRVQTTAHPRRVDDDSTSALFVSGGAIEVKAGASLVVACQYRDPDQRAARVAGIDMQTPSAAHGDYAFYSAKDGTGTDLTDSLRVTAVFGGNSAAVTIRNVGLTDGFIPAGALKLYGRGVYDFEPVIADVVDQDSIDAYGENRLPYDMPHQDDPTIADELARYLVHIYKDPRTRCQSVTFVAGWDEECALNAFDLQISDRITILAASAGIENPTQYYVNGFRFETKGAGSPVIVTLDLGPTDPTGYWLLEVPGSSELGETTILGYGLFKAGWILALEGASELGESAWLN
jgi:hypothetical protein